MEKELHNDINMEAAEYVLGILDASERAAFDAAMRDDVRLRDEVVYWEDQLADVGLKLPSVPPPASVWRNIQMQTGVRERTDKCSRRVSRWIPWSAAAGVAAVSLLAILFTVSQESSLQDAVNSQSATVVNTDSVEHNARFSTGPGAGSDFLPSGEAISWSKPKHSRHSYGTEAPDFIGEIQDYASSTGWQVAGFKARGALHVSATGKPYTQLWDPSTLELWLLPVNSWEEPISLGLLPAAGEREFQIAQHVASEFYTDYNKLAVSVERAGGSKTGQPMGDILFITTLRRAPAH